MSLVYVTFKGALKKVLEGDDAQWAGFGSVGQCGSIEFHNSAITKSFGLQRLVTWAENCLNRPDVSVGPVGITAEKWQTKKLRRDRKWILQSCPSPITSWVLLYSLFTRGHSTTPVSNTSATNLPQNSNQLTSVLLFKLLFIYIYITALCHVFLVRPHN